MPAGKPISREFHSAWSPEEVIDCVLVRSGTFRLYRVESHSPRSLVLVRRFTPTFAWATPLALAAAIFVLGVAGPGATVETAEAAGNFALLGLVAAGILAFVVKTDERVTISVRREEGSSRVIVAGSALPGLADLVSSWEEEMRESPPAPTGKRTG